MVCLISNYSLSKGSRASSGISLIHNHCTVIRLREKKEGPPVSERTQLLLALLTHTAKLITIPNLVVTPERHNGQTMRGVNK